VNIISHDGSSLGIIDQIWPVGAGYLASGRAPTSQHCSTGPTIVNPCCCAPSFKLLQASSLVAVPSLLLLVSPLTIDWLFLCFPFSRRIIDVQEDPAQYAELRQREDNFITDLLQPGLESERQVLAAVKRRQQEQEEQQRQKQQNNPG